MKNFGIKSALFINYFIFAALLNSVGLLIQKSINNYGVLESQAGILELFKDGSIAITALIIGGYLPKLGFKRGLLGSLLLVFVGCLIMYFGDSFWSVKALFFCTGVSFGVVKVTVLALIGQVVENETEHQSLMSYIESTFMLGIAGAYILFPLFYSDTEPKFWLNIFLLLAVLIAIVFLIVLNTKFDETNNSDIPNESLGQSMNKMFGLLKRPSILIFGLFAFFYVMTEQGIMSWLPTFNQKVLGLSEKLAASMALILMLSIAFGRFISGIIVKKLHWYTYIMVCLVIAAMFIIIVLPMASGLQLQGISELGQVPMIGFVFPLIGMVLAPIYPLINSNVLSSTELHLHSTMAGLITLFSAVGGTLGSYLIGILFTAIGGDKAFYFVLIPMVILIVVITLLYRLNKKSTLPNNTISTHSSNMH